MNYRSPSEDHSCDVQHLATSFPLYLILLVSQGQVFIIHLHHEFLHFPFKPAVTQLEIRPIPRTSGREIQTFAIREIGKMNSRDGHTHPPLP